MFFMDFIMSLNTFHKATMNIYNIKKNVKNHTKFKILVL